MNSVSFDRAFLYMNIGTNNHWLRSSIYNVHDDAKDKEFELELSWICPESKNLHQFVPKEIAEEAERLAKVRKNEFSRMFLGGVT